MSCVKKKRIIIIKVIVNSRQTGYAYGLAYPCGLIPNTGNICEVLIFARGTNSRIQESREN